MPLELNQSQDDAKVEASPQEQNTKEDQRVFAERCLQVKATGFQQPVPCWDSFWKLVEKDFKDLPY